MWFIEAQTMIERLMNSSIVIVAADHPSLSDARHRFVAEVRAEQRFFGRAGASNPKPFPSLIARLQRDDAIRLAAVATGRIIALACISHEGEASVVVVESWRGKGVATDLMRAATERAKQAGHSKIFIRSSHRSRAAAALGKALGGTVVDMGRGRVDLIFPVESDTRSA